MSPLSIVLVGVLILACITCVVYWIRTLRDVFGLAAALCYVVILVVLYTQ